MNRMGIQNVKVSVIGNLVVLKYNIIEMFSKLLVT